MLDWIDDFLYGATTQDPDEGPRRTIEVTLEDSVLQELDEYLKEIRQSEFVPKSRGCLINEALVYWFRVHRRERILTRAFIGLSPREYLVMYTYLFEKPRPSLAAIARRLRIHPSRVYRIRQKALRRMRDPARSETFESFLDLLGRTPENYRRLGLGPKSRGKGLLGAE